MVEPLPIKAFSHVCIRVSSMPRSLAFYREVLDLDVVFDVELAGEPLAKVTGEAGAHGRMVGGLLGGTTVELLEISSGSETPQSRVAPSLGYTNISFSVVDLDAVHGMASSMGLTPGPIVDIGGVRMFFLADPDGTPIEIIEYPSGATTSTEMWRPAIPATLVVHVIDELAALAPKLAERADDIAAARRLPDDVVDALRDAGAFRIAAPHALGGPELTPREQTEVIETLSRYEASVGWCAMIGSDAPYYGSFLAPEAAAELWPSIDAITAGQIPPNGRAQPVDGGYLVSGRWAFGSGCTHADVIVGGCLVVDGDAPVLVDGRPDFVVACAPATSWTVLDTWHTTGLAGSGSNDYTADELFVPARHAFRFSDPVQRPEPLYGWPGMFFINMAGVALGLARHAIDEAIGFASEKLLLPEMVRLCDTSRARVAIARAEAAYGAARAYVYDTLDRFWETMVAGDEVGVDIRIAVALSRAHSFQMARDVAESMSTLVGAASIYQNHPLERLVRDAITMSQHIAAQERMYEMIGQLRLTGTSTMPLL